MMGTKDDKKRFSELGQHKTSMGLSSSPHDSNLTPPYPQLFNPAQVYHCFTSLPSSTLLGSDNEIIWIMLCNTS